MRKGRNRYSPLFLAKVILLPAVMAAVIFGCTPVRVYDLQCEYLTDPSGIDDPYGLSQAESFDGFSPRVSWKILAPFKYGTQKAYRAVVSDWQGNKLWDSGLCEGREQFCFIPGSILESSAAYRWKVGVRVRDKGSLKWRREARFSTGLLKDDWKGGWIRHPEADPQSHIWFRKRFDCRNPALPENPYSLMWHPWATKSFMSTGRRLTTGC